MFEASFYANQSEPNFLNRIIQCLDRCVSFSWSVSFIKKAELILLLPHLEKALSRGAKGKILTSTYQNFTDIASLETFLELNFKEGMSIHPLFWIWTLSLSHLSKEA